MNTFVKLDLSIHAPPDTFTFILTWAFMLYQEMNTFVKLDLSIHAPPGDEYSYFYFNLSIHALRKNEYFCQVRLEHSCSTRRWILLLLF